MPSTVKRAGTPLSGVRILVTRPEGQADKLLSGIRMLGGTANHIPFLAIEPILDTSALAQIAHQLSTYRACIFISANAVACASPILASRGWPPSVVGAAVGPGTAALLRANGVTQVIVPAHRFDSEGLLEEEIFSVAACRGKAFALIRGEGGRDLLAQTLRERGARVDELVVYRRRLHPQALARLSEWLEAGIQSNRLMLISSSDSLRRVMDSVSPAIAASLRHVPLLVPHPKIAIAAQNMGFNTVAVSAGGDDGLLESLRSYNGATDITNFQDDKSDRP